MSSIVDLSPVVVILFLTLIICSTVVFAIYCPFILRTARRRRECDRPSPMPDECPPASVIVYSQDEADRLETLLPAILSQDYSSGFEVIVVNDGESMEVRNVVSSMQTANKNLYLTHTPDGARALSRKKLGITLGIKAARHDAVVLTTAAARIESRQWLSMIMRNFNDPETGIVIGYASPVPYEDRKRGARRRAFDFAADNVAWLSSAIGRKTYRGTELNIAYRRELFFANKGFSRSLNLHFGDDDIFISEIASRDNTAVELSSGSIIRFDSYDYAKTMHDTAVRHRFTESFIKRKPFSRLALGEAALWGGVVSAAAMITAAPGDMLVISLASAFIVGIMTCACVSWRKAMNALDLRRLRLTLPWFILTHPLRRMGVAADARFSKQKKYTWD